MPVIDAHVHLYPPEVGADPGAWALARGEPHWARLCTRRRRDGRPVQGFPTVADLLRTMDAAGIDRAILLGWYWEKPDTCLWQNRFYADVVRAHPDRLAAFATVHAGSGPEAVAAELRRAREEGLCGVGELSPPAQGIAADDPGLAQVFAVAGELGLPVNLHVTDPQGRPYPGKIETPADDFAAWARAHPRTTFVLAHWGGGYPLTDPRFRALPNLRYDTAASPLLYDASIWREMVSAVGAEKIWFGSDFPLHLYPAATDAPEMSRLLAEAREAAVPPALLGDNAARALGWATPA